MDKHVKRKRHQVKKRKQQRNNPDQRGRSVKIKTSQEENSEVRSAASQPEATANDKATEKQPRVNEDAQQNIVNHPQHAGSDITDVRDKQ